MNPVECVPFPFYLPQLSVVLSLSAYCMGCHTAAAAGRAHIGRGKMLGCSALLWQLMAFVLIKLWRTAPSSCSKRNSPKLSCFFPFWCSPKTQKHVFKHIWNRFTLTCPCEEREQKKAAVRVKFSESKFLRAKALFGAFCPPPAQMSLPSPFHGDERTGDRIMR